MPVSTSQPKLGSEVAQPEFVRTAKAMLARRRSAEAINLLRRGLSIDPTNFEAALLLAKALITARRFRNAQKVLVNLLERREDSQAYQLLLRICLALKDPPTAFKVATRALARYPKDERLGRLYQQALDALEPEELPTEIDAQPLGALVGAAEAEEGELPDDVTEPVTPVTRRVSAAELELLKRMQAETSQEEILAEAEGIFAGQHDTEETPEAEAQAEANANAPETDTDPDGEPDTVEAAIPTPYETPATRGEAPRLVVADRPTARYGPLLGKGAPNLEKAVERFIAATSTSSQPQVFASLVGEGPAILRSTPPADAPNLPLIESDEDALEAETLQELQQLGEQQPAAEVPRVLSAPRLRLVEADPVPDAGLDAPTPSVPPQPLPEEQPTAPGSARPFARLGEATASVVSADLIPVRSAELFDVSVDRHPRPAPKDQIDPSPLPLVEADPDRNDSAEEITPSPAADIFPSFAPAAEPRGAREFAGSASIETPRARLDTPTQIGKRSVARPLPVAMVDRAMVDRAMVDRAMVDRPVGRPLPRYWPAWFAAGLLLLAATTVAALLVVRQGEAEQQLAEARQLARTYQAPQLRAALYRAKAAANLGGRNAEVLALAAAIHGQLAVEFGESDLEATTKLVDQAKHLGAAFSPRAAEDLARANAYLVVATRALPEATAYLRQALKRHPRNATIARLYAEALVRDGKIGAAARVLHQMPADDAGVLGSLADLQSRRGKPHGARTYLKAAASAGLSPEQVALRAARLELRDSGRLAKQARPRLTSLMAGPGAATLSRFELAWAQLIVAGFSATSDVATADTTLDRALRNAPLVDGEFRYQAARLLRRLGHLPRARQQLREARRQVPNEARYAIEEATLELLTDRPAEAARHLAALDNPPAAARAVLARAQVRLGNLTAARQTLASLPLGDVERRSIEARVLLVEGKPHQALRHLSGLALTDPRVALVRGRAELAAGELASAAASLDVVLYQRPRAAEALWARGSVARAGARGDKARHYLERAVSANPYRLRYQIDLARLLVMLGDFQAARPRFAAVLSQDPHNLAALAGRALTAVELNHRNMATDLYALRSSGHRNMATMLSMRRWMRLERWDRAEADLARLDRRWLADEPTGQRWQAAILRHRGQAVAASSVYYRLLRFARARPFALLGLSELALEGGDLFEAHKYARRTIESLKRGVYALPLRRAARAQLARCLERAEDYDGAIRELEALLRLDPKRFEALLALARVSSEIKEAKRALVPLRRALEIRPEHAGARRLLRQVCRELGDIRPQPTGCGTRS